MKEDVNKILEEDIDTISEEEKIPSDIAIRTVNLSVTFFGKYAIEDINIDIKKNNITAIIGPSGCGKSTLLRSFNFMHDLTPGAKVTGKIFLFGKDIREFNATDLRKKVGMVFQKPNPFPTMSIYENVISGIKYTNKLKKKEADEIVENALKQAGLWNEVKDRLKRSALELSGGQQQRLCIARSIAVSPEIILMDEPTSALDPKSTAIIEETIYHIKNNYTVVIVTHNMQQAARVSNYTAFMFLGKLIEIDRTRIIFTTPKEKLTEQYIVGKFG